MCLHIRRRTFLLIVIVCSDICTLNEAVILEKKTHFLALIDKMVWVSLYVIVSGLRLNADRIESRNLL
jgi:hypothetical protein